MRETRRGGDTKRGKARRLSVVGEVITRRSPDGFLAAYEDTRNPVFVWQEYASCRRAGRRMPRWVVAYLDQCASNIEALLKNPPAKGNVSDAISNAMQFERRVGRGANPFNEPYDAYQQRIVLAGMAKHLIEERKMPADKAYAEVARTGGVSKATVERAYAWQFEQHHDGLGAK